MPVKLQLIGVIYIILYLEILLKCLAAPLRAKNSKFMTLLHTAHYVVTECA